MKMQPSTFSAAHKIADWGILGGMVYLSLIAFNTITRTGSLRLIQ
jgi:hypothetical protein